MKAMAELTPLLKRLKLGAIFALLGVVYGLVSKNFGFGMWWLLFGLAPALMDGIQTIDPQKYFTTISSDDYSEHVKIAYLKAIQDKWSTRSNWFTALLVAIGITGALTLISIMSRSDGSGETAGARTGMLLMQWVAILAYGMAGIVLGIYGKLSSILNAITDQHFELKRKSSDKP